MKPIIDGVGAFHRNLPQVTQIGINNSINRITVRTNYFLYLSVMTKSSNPFIIIIIIIIIIITQALCPRQERRIQQELQRLQTTITETPCARQINHRVCRQGEACVHIQRGR
jgi:hypothetical protein